MKKYIAVFFATVLYATANAEDVIPDPEQWYLEAYGPMWAAAGLAAPVGMVH